MTQINVLTVYTNDKQTPIRKYKIPSYHEFKVHHGTDGWVHISTTELYKTVASFNNPNSLNYAYDVEDTPPSEEASQ